MARKRLKQHTCLSYTTSSRQRIRKVKALVKLYRFIFDFKDVFHLWNVVSLSCKHRTPFEETFLRLDL